MAQHTPVHLGASRVPMMDAAALDARTRPVDRAPTSIWLRHRLAARPQPEPVSARTRAREWIDRLAGRPVS